MAACEINKQGGENQMLGLILSSDRTLQEPRFKDIIASQIGSTLHKFKMKRKKKKPCLKHSALQDLLHQYYSDAHPIICLCVHKVEKHTNTLVLILKVVVSRHQQQLRTCYINFSVPTFTATLKEVKTLEWSLVF